MSEAKEYIIPQGYQIETLRACIEVLQDTPVRASGVLVLIPPGIIVPALESPSK